METVNLSSTRDVVEGDFVIVQLGDTRRLIQVEAKKQSFIAKEKFYLNNAIGKPFGSIYEMKQQQLHYIESQCVNELKLGAQLGTTSSGFDNRLIVDDGKSQKLSKDDIEELKSKECDSTEIVKTIVENSSSFVDKTQYSQEKYLKRKQAKYNKFITIIHPTIRKLTEMYFAQAPTKICNMRIDSLSLMLNFSNILDGGSYIVVEDCLGLLVASVLDRIPQNGHVIQVFPGQGPVSSFRQAVNALNLPSEYLLKILHGIPFGKAVDILKNTKECITDIEMTSNSIESSENQNSVISGKDRVKYDEKFKRRKQRDLETKTATELLETKKIDGLLVACRHHPVSVALPLLQFLSNSRPFVIHSAYLPPLVDCYKRLKESKEAVFLNITESWLRNYQVLPERTHPLVYTSNTGGYLLTGIKVAKSC